MLEEDYSNKINKVSKPYNKDSGQLKNYKRSFLNSKWAEKFRWFIRTPKRSILGGAFCCALTYAAIYNSVVYFIYGKDHPINRYNWRRMERNGQLSKELIEKKKQMDAYYFDVLSQVRLWKWENDRHPNVFSFNKTNFD